MTHSAELRAIERNQELFMCICVMHFTDILVWGGGVGGGGCGDYVVVVVEHTQLETGTCPA